MKQYVDEQNGEEKNVQRVEYRKQMGPMKGHGIGMGKEKEMRLGEKKRIAER